MTSQRESAVESVRTHARCGVFIMKDVGVFIMKDVIMKDVGVFIYRLFAASVSCLGHCTAGRGGVLQCDI